MSTTGKGSFGNAGRRGEKKSQGGQSKGSDSSGSATGTTKQSSEVRTGGQQNKGGSGSGLQEIQADNGDRGNTNRRLAKPENISEAAQPGPNARPSGTGQPPQEHRTRIGQPPADRVGALQPEATLSTKGKGKLADPSKVAVPDMALLNPSAKAKLPVVTLPTKGKARLADPSKVAVPDIALPNRRSGKATIQSRKGLLRLSNSQAATEKASVKEEELRLSSSVRSDRKSSASQHDRTSKSPSGETSSSNGTSKSLRAAMILAGLDIERGPLVPLSQPFNGVQGMPPGSIWPRAMTEWEAQQVEARLTLQYNELKDRLLHCLDDGLDHFEWEEQQHDSARKYDDVPMRAAHRMMFTTYNKALSIAHKFQKSGRSQQTQWTRATADRIQDYRQNFEMRWRAMEHKRRVLRLEFYYYQWAGIDSPVEYPGGMLLPTWSEEAYRIGPARLLTKFNDRRKSLLDALMVNTSRYCEVNTDDYVTCARAGQNDPTCYSRSMELLEHPEVVDFLQRDRADEQYPSGGLLINGADFDADDGSLSKLSAFMSLYIEENAQRDEKHVTLTHAAGLRDSGLAHVHLRGVAGLLRSLCTQILVADPPFEITLNFATTEDQAFWHGVQTGDHVALLTLFRHLLYDIARSNLDPQYPHYYVITIIVDGVHFLEQHEPVAYSHVVDWLRTICDETFWGHLSRKIALKYILLHPGMSTLLQFPYPSERPIILDPPQ